MTFRKTVQVESMGTDRYQRKIGRVTVDGLDVKAAMLDAGLAWYYTQYDKTAFTLQP